jgi:hypothetical protein
MLGAKRSLPYECFEEGRSTAVATHLSSGKRAQGPRSRPLAYWGERPVSVAARRVRGLEVGSIARFPREQKQVYNAGLVLKAKCHSSG